MAYLTTLTKRQGTMIQPLRLRKSALHCALFCSILAISDLTVAADSLSNTASSPTQAYNIPAGQLSDVLNQFAISAGISLQFDSSLTRGLNSQGLNGEYSIQESLVALLAGTQLSAVQKNGIYTLEQDGDAVIMLPTVEVEGSALNETGFSHVDGYVATQSITAGKSDIPLIETPQTLNIVTADQLDIQNAESMHQALKYTPGITSMGGDSLASDGVIIRGFNATGTGPYYLNGSRLPRNTFSGVGEPYSMERVEVLKGPSSVLYGSAAPGGIVNMVSKMPQKEQQGELKFQGGSFDRKQLAGDVTGSMTEDGSLSYRVTGLLRDSDTMTDYVPDDRQYLQGALTWELSADTSLTLLANYQNNETAYVYGLPAEGTVLPNINGEIDRNRFVGEPEYNKFDVQNHTLSYLFSHQFNDQISFRQNVLFFDAETDYNDVWIGSLDGTQQVISRGIYAREDDDRTWSIDNQLEMKWDLGNASHTSLIGLDYVETEFERAQTNGTVAGLNLYDPVYGSPVTAPNSPTSHWKNDTEQLGFYVQDQTKLEQWVFMMGGRYDTVKATYDNKLTNTSETTYDDNAFTGRAGVVYLFDNGWAPYISYSQSFQPSSGQDINGEAFKPTEGEQYEVGVRYEPQSKNMTFIASVYDLTQKNVSTSDLDNPGFSIQEGEVRSRGLELEAKANLTNHLNFIATYSYINNEVTQSNSGTEGNQFGAVPNHAASVWVDYTFDDSLGLGAGVRYIGKSKNLANTYEAPSYTVVDAMASYKLPGNWDLALNINNLFDKKYASCTYACFYGVERSVTATATFGW